MLRAVVKWLSQMADLLYPWQGAHEILALARSQPLSLAASISELAQRQAPMTFSLGKVVFITLLVMHESFP